MSSNAPPTASPPIVEPVHQTYRSDDQAPRLARQDLAEALAAWGLGKQDSAVLAVSELVTNAVRHTWRPCGSRSPRPPLASIRVTLQILDLDRIQLSVHDQDVHTFDAAFRALSIARVRCFARPAAVAAVAYSPPDDAQLACCPETGRGMELLLGVADSIDCELHHDGKTMVAVVPLEPLERTEPPAAAGA